EPMHQGASPMLLGQPVAVHHKRAPPAQIELRFATKEFDSQVVAKKAAAPAIVIAADECDGNAARPNGLQLRDGGERFARVDGVVLEPEVEEITGKDQVIPRLRDLVEERVKGCA